MRKTIIVVLLFAASGCYKLFAELPKWIYSPGASYEKIAEYRRKFIQKPRPRGTKALKERSSKIRKLDQIILNRSQKTTLKRINDLYPLVTNKLEVLKNQQQQLKKSKFKEEMLQKINSFNETITTIRIKRRSLNRKEKQFLAKMSEKEQKEFRRDKWKLLKNIESLFKKIIDLQKGWYRKMNLPYTIKILPKFEDPFKAQK